MELTTTQTDRHGVLTDASRPLLAWLAERREPAMRVKQIRRWLFVRGQSTFADMTDLPVSLRDELSANFSTFETSIAKHLQSSDDTHKLLVELRDGGTVESVLIQDAGRRTACISTQVGCGMGCVFCASGLDGVKRNLTVAEIVEQLLHLARLPGPMNGNRQRLTHIVVMGMGEPLANLDALCEALQLATAKEGLGIGARHITISTVGLPDQIRRLADLNKQYHLAVSLHAPDDELRTRIVPTNAKIGIDDILAASDYFFHQTRRQVTFEYVLLGGLNDAVEHAKQLGRLLRGRKAHVNLIPFNDVEGLPYRRPTQESVASFCDELIGMGISVKVRKRKGSEIDAACGQLRRKTADA